MCLKSLIISLETKNEYHPPPSLSLNTHAHTLLIYYTNIHTDTHNHTNIHPHTQRNRQTDTHIQTHILYTHSHAYTKKQTHISGNTAHMNIPTNAYSTHTQH